MKTLLFIFLFSVSSFASDFTEPTKHAEKYLLVAVSGFKTGRNSSEEGNIFSNRIGKGFEESGVWDNMNTLHPKIFKTVYLTHFSKNAELQEVMKLVTNDKGECKENQGLIMMVNSWGAKMSQKLASMYLKKCNRLPHLTIMIDGVSKPTPFAYDTPILAFNCMNFYQQSSNLQGAPIENCHNILSVYKNERDLFYSHINLEWSASRKGYDIIQDYLNDKLPVMFARDLHHADYKKGL